MIHSAQDTQSHQQRLTHQTPAEKLVITFTRGVRTYIRKTKISYSAKGATLHLNIVITVGRPSGSTNLQES